MNNKWHEIWEKRSADENELFSNDSKRVLLELKRVAGYDSTGKMLDYEQFYNHFVVIKNELEFCALSGTRPMKSIYEVGCGCGSSLYLFQLNGIEVGGSDYSSAEIKIAEKVLNAPKELFCEEASNILLYGGDEVKYDAVFSNSVFSYFESYEYAEKVLEAMYCKTNYSIGILDIHDDKKKDAFIEYRKRIHKNYEERYKDLPKFFYKKEFFLEFAERHDMSIRFSKTEMQDYWNGDYAFDCFMIKNLK